MTQLVSRAVHELLVCGNAKEFDRLLEGHESMTDEGLDVVLNAAQAHEAGVGHPPCPPRPPCAERLILVPVSLLRRAARLRDLEIIASDWKREMDERSEAVAEAKEVERLLEQAINPERQILSDILRTNRADVAKRLAGGKV